MKTQRKSLLNRYGGFGLLIAGALCAGLLLASNMTTVSRKLIPSELASLNYRKAGSFRTGDVLNAPLRLLQVPYHLHLPGPPIMYARMPSVIMGIASFLLFAYVTRRWYGRRSMLIGCMLFVSSAWFLHIGRSAGADIEYLTAMLALLAVHVGLFDRDKSRPMFFLWLVVNVTLLYIPGFLWFVLLSIFWQRRVLLIAWKQLQPAWYKVIWSCAAAAGIAPVIYMLISQPWQLRPWLGLPFKLPEWLAAARQVGNTFAAFVYRGPYNPQIWLGRLPILDACVTALAVIGIIFYAVHWRASRTRLLLGYIVLGSLLVGIQGGVPLSVMVPLVYFIAVGGLAYVLYIWLSHFPNNGVARAAGITAVVMLVCLSCAYNLQAYFVAWPRSPDTIRLISLR